MGMWYTALLERFPLVRGTIISKGFHIFYSVCLLKQWPNITGMVSGAKGSLNVIFKGGFRILERGGCVSKFQTETILKAVPSI